MTDTTRAPAYETLFHRHTANPILSAADWPYPVHSVFNPGATRLHDGTTLLLCRVEDRRGLSHLCAALEIPERRFLFGTARGGGWSPGTGNTTQRVGGIPPGPRNALARLGGVS